MNRALAKLSLLLFAATPGAWADEIVYDKNVDTVVPDGSTSGVLSTIEVAELGTIDSLRITLNLEVPDGATGFTGDLYAYVQHGDRIAVLLNRPGRDSGRPSGYDDSVNLSVTFDDSAARGDIHGYRAALNGSHAIPLTFSLTGLWQPDGRIADPDSVLLSHARSAMLSEFTGEDSEGAWTIFVSDVSSGGQIRFTDWRLAATFTPIPEPNLCMTAALLALGFAVRQTRRRRNVVF